MPPAGAITRVTPQQCPECNHKLDAIGAFQDDDPRGPRPGDPIACIRCGAVMTLEAGKLRGFTVAEMDELVADTEAMDELEVMVGRIHLLRHARN